MRLNITDDVLDKIGFSEYWDDDGDSGTRTLSFKNGDRLVIVEYLQMDDDTEGYLTNGIYRSDHYLFVGYKAIPKSENDYDLFFLEQMYEVIKELYPNCLNEFLDKCREVKMIEYVQEHIAETETKTNEKEI